jgi:hypothetical protein
LVLDAFVVGVSYEQEENTDQEETKKIRILDTE